MSSVEFGMQTPGVEFSAGSIKKELNVSELNATFGLKNYDSFMSRYCSFKVNDTVPL